MYYRLSYVVLRLLVFVKSGARSLVYMDTPGV